MKSIFWVALGAVLTACDAGAHDDGDPPQNAAPYAPTGFRDGSRLVGRTLSFPGTEPLLIGVHDTLTGRDCAFVPEANNASEYRCQTSDARTEGVRGKLVVDPSDRTLSTSWIQSDDGSRFPPAGKGGAQIVDTRWDVPCWVQSAEEGMEVACVPEAAIGSLFFSDATCTMPLAYASSHRRIAYIDGGLFALGSRWEGTTFSAPSDGCKENSADFGTGLHFFPIASALADKIARVQVAHPGEGRLLRRKVFSESKELALHPYEAFFDTLKQAVCSPMRTGGSTIRCVSDVGLYQDTQPVFADKDCTKRAAIGYGGPTVGDLIAIGQRSSSEVPTASSLHAVVSILGHAIFRNDTGTCVQMPSRQTVVELSAAKSWDEFAELEETPPAIRN